MKRILVSILFLTFAFSGVCVWAQGNGKDALAMANDLRLKSQEAEDVHDFTTAIDTALEAIKYYQQTAETDPELIYWLTELSRYSNDARRLADAFTMQQEALRLYEKLPEKNSPTLGYIYYLMSGTIHDLGDLPSAIKYAKQAESLLPKDSYEFSNLQSNMALFYYELGQKERALKMKEDLFNHIIASDPDHESVAYAMDDMGDFYLMMGNIEKGKKMKKGFLDYLIKEYEDAVSGNFGFPCAVYASAMAGCVDILKKEPDWGGYRKPIDAQTGLYITKEQYEDTDVYLPHLLNLAAVNDVLGKHREAIALRKKALEVYKLMYGQANSNCSRTLQEIAESYREMDDMQPAIENLDEAIRIMESLSYPEMSLKLSLYQDMVRLMEKTGDGVGVATYSQKASETMRDYLKSSFLAMTTQDRNSFWEENNKWFLNDLPGYALSYRSPALNETAFDAALISKGILLSTESELKKMLQGINDDEISRKYKQWISLKQRLAALSEEGDDESTKETEKVSQEARALEQYLIDKSRDFGDFTKGMSISWREVRDSLQDGELAIEFFAVPDSEGDERYFALTIKNDYQSPVLTPLFNGIDIKGIPDEDIYETKKLSDLVWKPLDSELKGAGKVYFSPAGVLYQLGIESLPAYDGEGFVSDMHEIYRLSSSRELVMKSAEPEYKKGVVYGGLDYMMTVADIRNNSERLGDTANQYLAYEEGGTRGCAIDSLRAIQEDLSLPASLEEAKDIKEMLENHNIPTDIFTHNLGTERSFKNLSGEKYNLLHIATHGYYLNGNVDSSTEDAMLQQTGLLMAGCQIMSDDYQPLSASEIPDDIDDGYLSAFEIKDLEFGDMGLVVLSACETGLGNISSDGVYGLQRAFKKAGAGTLLMSLWNVNDTATSLLMKEFYRHLLEKGCPPHEALERAKSTLQSTEDYASPTYWAAFILLDAI